MAFFLDPNTLEMIQLSENSEQPSILCENFTWLLDNLHSFDPAHTLADKHWSQPGRGLRREIRGADGKSLGYNYFTHAKYNEFAGSTDTNITNKGIITINSFGYPVNVERWEVSAPWPVKDVAKKETYYGPGGRKSPGGAYVCLITARADLRDEKKTRCYVSCNCKDFKYSFLHDLKDKKYTDPNAEEPAKGRGYKVEKDGNTPKKDKQGNVIKTIPVAHDAAICKHLYAILKLFYGKFIDAESGAVENPELFVDQEVEKAAPGPVKITPYPKPKQVPTPPPPPPPIVPPVRPVMPPPVLGQKPKPLTKTEVKAAVKLAIIDALMAADSVIPSDNLDSYQDPRKFSSSNNRPLHYHKYKFAVRVETSDGRASIYYMNPVFAGSTTGQKILTIPKLSRKDSYYLFSPKELHDIVFKYSTPISDALLDKIDSLVEKGTKAIYLESILQMSDEMQILNESSPIMQSLLELKFRTNICQ